jgi:hypothetical protein
MLGFVAFRDLISFLGVHNKATPDDDDDVAMGGVGGLSFFIRF